MKKSAARKLEPAKWVTPSLRTPRGRSIAIALHIDDRAARKTREVKMKCMFCGVFLASAVQLAYKKWKMRLAIC